jgi:hypothetical protein
MDYGQLTALTIPKFMQFEVVKVPFPFVFWLKVPQTKRLQPPNILLETIAAKGHVVNFF